MNETLRLLYDRFYIPLPMAESEQEVETCHRQLIERLDKPERKLVLRIIDAQNLMIVSMAGGGTGFPDGRRFSFCQTRRYIGNSGAFSGRTSGTGREAGPEAARYICPPAWW